MQNLLLLPAVVPPSIASGWPHVFIWQMPQAGAADTSNTGRLYIHVPLLVVLLVILVVVVAVVVVAIVVAVSYTHLTLPTILLV